MNHSHDNQYPVRIAFLDPEGQVVWQSSHRFGYHPAPDGLPASPLARFLFSPLQREVVKVLLSVARAKGSTIGARLREKSANGQASPKLRVVLASMVERGVLTHGPGGYALSKDFRPLAEGLLGKEL